MEGFFWGISEFHDYAFVREANKSCRTTIKTYVMITGDSIRMSCGIFADGTMRAGGISQLTGRGHGEKDRFDPLGQSRLLTKSHL